MKQAGLGRGEFFVLIVFLVFAISIITYFAAFETAKELPQDQENNHSQNPGVNAQYLTLNKKSVPGLFNQATDQNINSSAFISQLQGISSYQFDRFYSGWQSDFVAQSSKHSRDSYSVIKNLAAVTSEQDAKDLLQEAKNSAGSYQVDLNEIEQGLADKLGEEALLVKKSVGNLTYYQLHLREGPLYNYVFIAGANPSAHDIVLYGLSVNKHLEKASAAIESGND